MTIRVSETFTALHFDDVPRFARIADWFGLWSMEPMALAGHLALLRGINLAAHVREAETPKLQSAIEKVPSRGGQSIAVIKIAGTMMKSASSMGGTSTVQMRRDVRAAAADPEVSGILLFSDSPGGSVAGTDDLANDVRAARRQKPVYGHVDDLSASANYWVMSQADKIYANSPTALVGSIGTMTVVYDMSKAAENEGVKALLFATGPLKGAGAPGTVVTEEQRANFQDLIDKSQRAFDSAVKRGRGLTDSQLTSVRTGGVFLADDAVNNKLIDGIQSMSKTMDELAKASVTQKSQQAAMADTLPVFRQELPMLS